MGVEETVNIAPQTKRGLQVDNAGSDRLNIPRCFYFEGMKAAWPRKLDVSLVTAECFHRS